MNTRQSSSGPKQSLSDSKWIAQCAASTGCVCVAITTVVRAASSARQHADTRRRPQSWYVWVECLMISVLLLEGADLAPETSVAHGLLHDQDNSSLRFSLKQPSCESSTIERCSLGCRDQSVLLTGTNESRGRRGELDGNDRDDRVRRSRPARNRCPFAFRRKTDPRSRSLGASLAPVCVCRRRPSSSSAMRADPPRA